MVKIKTTLDSESLGSVYIESRYNFGHVFNQVKILYVNYVLRISIIFYKIITK